jgi:hypothetical protein
MDQESIVLEIDGRSVLGVIKQANQAVEGWEKGTVGAGERMQKSLERMAEMLLKVNDKSYNSMERLTQSIEKQASAYGRTPIERLVAQRDRLVKKLGDEQGMVERVTKAYERMIEVEQKKGGSSGGVTQAIQEIVGKNSTLGGLAGGLAGGFAFEAIKDTVTEVGKSLYDMANKAKETAMELHELSERSGVSVTQLGALKATMEDVTGKSDGFEAGIGRMARSITAATQGSTKQVEAYRELGVSADFVKQHHNDVLAIMEKISEHMEKSKTPLQDYANLQLVMRNGAAAYYSVLKEGPNALRDLVTSHKELGDAIEANTGPARELNKVQQDLHHMWQLWTAQSLPLVVSTLRWVTDALLSARAGWELFLNDIEHGMMTLAARLQQAQAMMSAAMKGDMQGVNAARDVYNAAITINTGVMQNRQRDIMTQYTQDLAHLYAKPPENHAAPTEDIEPENAKTQRGIAATKH